MLNIDEICGNCLVKTCCINEYGTIRNPCDKIKDLIYEHATPTWDPGVYKFENACYQDSTEVFVVTDISMEDHFFKKNGETLDAYNERLNPGWKEKHNIK